MTLMLAGSIGACAGSSEPSTAERCRELEPNLSAEQAWDDISALQEVMAEYMALNCDTALAED